MPGTGTVGNFSSLALALFVAGGVWHALTKRHAATKSKRAIKNLPGGTSFISKYRMSEDKKAQGDLCDASAQEVRWGDSNMDATRCPELCAALLSRAVNRCWALHGDYDTKRL